MLITYNLLFCIFLCQIVAGIWASLLQPPTQTGSAPVKKKKGESQCELQPQVDSAAGAMEPQTECFVSVYLMLTLLPWLFPKLQLVHWFPQWGACLNSTVLTALTGVVQVLDPPRPCRGVLAQTLPCRESLSALKHLSRARYMHPWQHGRK